MALFQANIHNDITEDKLVEQLYIFLNEYVSTRLIYENTAEKEDCTQDTIMYLLHRYNSLTEIEKEELNLEKFFYNRARSYISLYIRKLKKERKDKADYIDMCHYLKHDIILDSIYSVDDVLLSNIVSKYRLDKEKLEILKTIASIKLTNMFSTQSIKSPIPEETDDTDLLHKLSVAVIDEYIVESAIYELQEKEKLGEKQFD